VQHERAPRPLPLFLEMVRRLGESDPETARKALKGLAVYEQAERVAGHRKRPIAAQHKGVCLREIGGSGAAVILVPSLINPPHILDLDDDVSLGKAIAGMGRRALLVDWGDARKRSDLNVGDHVEQLLVPLLRGLGEPAALVGYCLGGTMAIAAANLTQVERVATLAAPWHFSRYPEASRTSLQDLWRGSAEAAARFQLLPMEVLQAAFWSLDPTRTASKFAKFADADPAGDEARRFVTLEDWANDGEPLPLPAARELMEDFFGADDPGKGQWCVGGETITDELSVPVLHCTATSDRITPGETAASGEHRSIAAGHVGMIVGSARGVLHEALGDFLAPCR
jgi:polyhydroxyalkanoate synthase subunit PhaC